MVDVEFPFGKLSLYSAWETYQGFIALGYDPRTSQLRTLEVICQQPLLSPGYTTLYRHPHTITPESGSYELNQPVEVPSPQSFHRDLSQFPNLLDK